MKNYKVLWLSEALDDLEEVMDYIHFERPLTAKHHQEKIHRLAESLVHNPKRGRIIPELTVLDHFSFRELVIPPWRLMYEIDQDEVKIIAFVDSRREINDFIYRRLVNTILTSSH